MADPEHQATEHQTPSTTDDITNTLNASTISDSHESNAETPQSTEIIEEVRGSNNNTEDTTDANSTEDESNLIDEALVAEHQNKIDLYQSRMENSVDEDYRPTAMVELASSMADLCTAREKAPSYATRNLALLHKASEKARDAIEMVDEEYHNWAYVIASSANIFYTLYDASKEVRYLDETIDASEKAVDCYVNKEFFARRSYRLAAQLQERWIRKIDNGDHADLEAAIRHAKVATDNTYWFSEAGQWRLCLYSQLVTEHAAITKDVKSLEALIDFHVAIRDGTIVQDDPGRLDEREKKEAVRMNIIFLEMAYCWHWGLTKNAADLDLLATCVAKNLANEDSDQCLMLREAVRVFQIREIDRHDSRYEVPLLALELIVWMHQYIWDNLPKTKISHLDILQDVAYDCRNAAYSIYERTGLAKWGWIYDDFNTLESRVNVLLMSAKDYKPEDDISPGMISGVGDSVVLKKQLHIPMIKDLWYPGHIFLEDIKPENYIRKRNEDGTIELGLTEENEVAFRWYHDSYATNEPV